VLQELHAPPLTLLAPRQTWLNRAGRCRRDENAAQPGERYAEARSFRSRAHSSAVEHSPYKRGVTGSIPVAPTSSEHISILKKKAGNRSGNHPCMLFGVAKGAQGRGTIIFDHEGAPCTDSRFHRHCKGRWRGVLSQGFGPDGRRRRYKVSGRTKKDVVDALNKKREELDAGLATSRSYKVERAALEWLAQGLPGRSERTRQIYRDALAPLLKKIGHRTLRDLTAEDVEAGLNSLSKEFSSRSLQIAHNSLRRTIRYAEARGKVGRNVAALVDTPKGRAGRRRRAFTLPQAAALILASRELPVLELPGGLKDPRRPASLMHAYITVSLMAGVRPEEARAISWRHDVGLDGTPPYVAALRADRAGGDTKTPKSRRALKLPQMAVVALKHWKADQAAERAAAGSRWEDSSLIFTTATGTPLYARTVRRMFQDICERAGLGREWAPRDLRHTFVSLLSDDGMAIAKIARLVGHASSHVTESVYRQELRPVLQEGAEVMDRIFWSLNGELPDAAAMKQGQARPGGKQRKATAC
jgi:site-specific recombinase XerD